jgi:hypothetical protein
MRADTFMASQAAAPSAGAPAPTGETGDMTGIDFEVEVEGEGKAKTHHCITTVECVDGKTRYLTDSTAGSPPQPTIKLLKPLGIRMLIMRFDDGTTQVTAYKCLRPSEGYGAVITESELRYRKAHELLGANAFELKEPNGAIFSLTFKWRDPGAHQNIKTFRWELVKLTPQQARDACSTYLNAKDIEVTNTEDRVAAMYATMKKNVANATAPKPAGDAKKNENGSDHEGRVNLMKFLSMFDSSS